MLIRNNIYKGILSGSYYISGINELLRPLSKLAGVPFTSFDGDQADYRNYSEAQFETRIQGLVEVMSQKKGVEADG